MFENTRMRRLLFKISPGKPLCLDLLDTGGVHIDPEDRSHDKSDPGFAFTALADQQEHLLSLSRGKHAVPQVLLQRRDIEYLDSSSWFLIRRKYRGAKK